MLVVPVEKEGRFSSSYVLRFLCFDPETRMAYLSGKGTHSREWKHRLKLYACVPHYDSSTKDFRSASFDANDLFTFALYGVTHHRLQSGDPNSRREAAKLPNLLQNPYQDSRPSFGTYREGTQNRRPSSDPVSPADDAEFFAKDRETWTLRCPFYSACHDMLLLMRDTLIADGLHLPVHGGFDGGIDPRFGLPFAPLPLYLQRSFRSLLNTLLYTCIHGDMIGRGPRGELGVCVRHCYLCVTDTMVLYLSEDGKAVRWQPLNEIQTVDLNLDADTPYSAVLMSSGAPDVLFFPSPPFVAGEDSPSMVAAMPTRTPKQQLTLFQSVLRKLRGPPLTTSAEVDQVADYDADLALEDTDLADPSLNLPEGGSSSGDVVQLVPRLLTLKEYVRQFPQLYSREFRWQPQTSYTTTMPKLTSAEEVARNVGLAPHVRQEITYRREFEPFYFAGLREAAPEEPPERRALSGPAPGGDIPSDDLYAPLRPVEKSKSKLKTFAPIV